MSEQDHLGSIFFQYDLFPDQIETVGKVKKLYTSRGTFALKETGMTASDRNEFAHVLHRLKDLDYSHYLPVIPTKYGDEMVVSGEKTYYLMAWIDDNAESGLSRERVLIENAAVLHAMTEKKQHYSERILVHSYRTLLKKWQKQEQEMERFIEGTENGNDLSPFHFTFVSNKQLIRKWIKESKDYLSHWYNTCMNNRSIRGVLCHGKLSHRHFICHQSTSQFINFEHAQMDTPVRDLAILFRKVILNDKDSARSTGEMFEYYERLFPLNPEEKSLLAGYLVFPEYVYLLMKEYQAQSLERTEPQYVQRLEKAFTVLKKLRVLSRNIAQAKLYPPSQKSDV